MRRLLILGSFAAGFGCLTGAGFYGYCHFNTQAEAAQLKTSEPAPPTMTNSIGMKLALIPAGKFMMGSPEEELHRHPDELQHEVAITRPFYLGVHETTQAEYEKVMGSNPSYFTAKSGGKLRVQNKDTSAHSVERISWEDAAEYCKKLGAQEGKTYRLPTEAEWEYACRAGTTTVFHVGNDFNSNLANVNGLSYASYGAEQAGPFYRSTIRVGRYKANAFGLFDMHGNVQEWCSDWYDRDYYRHSPKNDPQGPAAGAERVIRGGGWPSSSKVCRSAARNHLPPEEKSYTSGFRVALEVK